MVHRRSSATLPAPIVVSVRGAGSLLGLNGDAVRKMIHEGRLRASRLGRQTVRIRLTEIERVLSEREIVTKCLDGDK